MHSTDYHLALYLQIDLNRLRHLCVCVYRQTSTDCVICVCVSGIAKDFTKGPEPMSTFIGGAARFDCSIKASPPATIVWQKDNVQLTVDDPAVFNPRYLLILFFHIHT